MSEVSGVYARVRHRASDAALAIRRAAVTFWTAFRTTHRDITHLLAISAAFHLIVLLGDRLARSTSTVEDDTDVPELSVQIETREGPNSEEFTEAALPQPAPDPVEDVLDDPGTADQTLDAAAVADATPVLEQAPDVNELDTPEAMAQAGEISEATGPVLATTGESSTQVPEVPEPVDDAGGDAAARAGDAHARTCSSSRRNCSTPTLTQHRTHLAAGWPAIFRARHAPAGRRQHRPRTGGRRNHDRQGRQAHEDAPVAQAPGVLAFHAARESLGSEHPAARRRDRRPFSQQHRDRHRHSAAGSSRVSSAR